MVNLPIGQIFVLVTFGILLFLVAIARMSEEISLGLFLTIGFVTVTTIIGCIITAILGLW